jgi:hypothetical protein
VREEKDRIMFLEENGRKKIRVSERERERARERERERERESGHM